MSIPCLSPYTPRGLAPNTRLANGSAALIAVGNTSRTQFIKHLKRYSVMFLVVLQLDFPFVEAHTVTAVRIRPRALIGAEEESEEEPTGAFPWNMDGELVRLGHEVLIRVHPRLLCLYGQEVEQAESTASCGCI
uniref:Ceramide kinase C-terminal domain-containing protein n=1 Tax=Neogobius melanostomus TaxID=47308 RepID=A0A8C6T7T3_9GOBI